MLEGKTERGNPGKQKKKKRNRPGPQATEYAYYGSITLDVSAFTDPPKSKGLFCSSGL
jgi:hypothetical protein